MGWDISHDIDPTITVFNVLGCRTPWSKAPVRIAVHWQATMLIQKGDMGDRDAGKE